jgi:hypothetical protein
MNSVEAGPTDSATEVAYVSEVSGSSRTKWLTPSSGRPTTSSRSSTSVGRTRMNRGPRCRARSKTDPYADAGHSARLAPHPSARSSRQGLVRLRGRRKIGRLYAGSEPRTAYKTWMRISGRERPAGDRGARDQRPAYAIQVSRAEGAGDHLMILPLGRRADRCATPTVHPFVQKTAIDGVVP